MAMTLGDLRKAWAHLPDETPVILQEDAEANGYSPLEAADEAMYAADTTWSGEAFLTPEQLAAMEHPEDWDPAPGGAVRVLLLIPVN